MTAGALIAIAMMVFLELTSPRRKRLRVALDIESLPKLKDFLEEFATKAGWDSESMQRLTLVGEETLTSLLSAEGDDVDRDKPHSLSCERAGDRGRGGAGVCVDGRRGKPGGQSGIRGRISGIR